MEKKNEKNRKVETIENNQGVFVFVFACHLKPLTFFLVYQNGNFYWEKAKLTMGKIGKSDFVPTPKFFSVMSLLNIQY